MLYERLKNSGYDSVMTGSLTEGRLIDSESESMGTLLKNICGQTELKVLMAILSKADLVVANSTGPLHLAAATGTKVIGLYPAGKTVSPVRWKPIGSPCRILLPFGQGADMKSITVESVLGQIESLLSVPAESGSRI